MQLMIHGARPLQLFAECKQQTRNNTRRKLLPEHMIYPHQDHCGFHEKSITVNLQQQHQQQPQQHRQQQPHQPQPQAADLTKRGMSKRQILSLALLLLVGFADASSHHQHKTHRDAPSQAESPISPEYTTSTQPPETSSNNNNNGSDTDIVSNRIKIPGLYEERWITSLQGQLNFERLIYNGSSSNNNKSTEVEQSISLIQYYMATCPDCQGFSPYFKRFVSDIGPHWRHLVRVYTINCNDEININLCWQQNPTLIVPLVRWYTFSQILLDAKRPTNDRLFRDYPLDLLNVAHRGYIKKQRRDLISLRHATLRYIESILDQLSSSAASSNNSSDDNEGQFYSKLPIRFKLLKPLGGDSRRNDNNNNNDESAKEFFEAIIGRTRECSSEKQGTNVTVENFIVFEKPGSYVGKTLVADWSNWTCVAAAAAAASADGDGDGDDHDHDNNNNGERKFMFHYSNNLDLLHRLNVIDSKVQQSSSSNHRKLSMNHKDVHNRQPLLVSVKTNSQVVSLDQLEFHLLASNHSIPQHHHKRSRRHDIPDLSHAEHSLEHYYTSRRFHDPAVAKNKLAQQQVRLVKKRLRRSPPATNTTVDYNEAENINWGPEYIYSGEEATRYRYNQIVAHRINKTVHHLISVDDVPGANFRGESPGEIARIKPDTNGTIPAKEDDLTLLKLTDYYKVLDEIIHKNILSRAEVDGYQLIGATCFVRHLSRQFPFQGQQSAQQKSIARHYLELLYQKFSELLAKKGVELSFQGCSGNLLREQRVELEKLKVSTKELQEIQTHTRKEFDIGLPSEKHFKWQYCAGSSEYLRGHTCSLWVLFHTLTVQEYLNNRDHHSRLIEGQNCTTKKRSSSSLSSEDQAPEYKFMVKYSEDKEKCDPGNPEPALVSAKTSELFQEPLNFVLSNIINFVRYYLSCTNCAAHFNCMVLNSPGLNLCNPRADDHLLWLWEAHNRVNVRTRSTHSEDPNRPKHVFPVYEACPECYLEQPTNQTSFEQMKFNRKSVVEFLVARYRKSAILNNKIKIEDLFRKAAPVQALRAGNNSSSSSSSSSSPESITTNEPNRGGESFKLTHRLTALVM